jgi:hypothetical protein
MAAKDQVVLKDVMERIMSDLRRSRKTTETLDISHTNLGQRCPSLCPEPCPQHSTTPHLENNKEENLLGQAMGIGQVARLLGCSVWTVRQRYMPHGLPYLRASASGKLVFFRQQVIDWILKQQQKGGNRP